MCIEQILDCIKKITEIFWCDNDIFGCAFKKSVLEIHNDIYRYDAGDSL